MATVRASGRSTLPTWPRSAASPSTRPTEQRPLVINVDGDGGRVLLDRAVTVDAGPGPTSCVERRRREGRRRGAAARRKPARPDRAGGDRRRRARPGRGRFGGAARRDRRRHAVRRRAAEDRRHDDDHRAAHLNDAARHQRGRASREAFRGRAAGDRQQRRDHRQGRRRSHRRPAPSAPCPGSPCALRRRRRTDARPVTGHVRRRASPTPTATARSSCPTPSAIGGANRDRRFWVVQTGVADRLVRANPPWSPEPTLRSRRPVPVPDRRSAPRPAHATPRRHQRDVHDRHGQHEQRRHPAASGRPRATTRRLPTKCGLNVALVLDLSGSVAAVDSAALKTAANTFTNSLVGTPSQVGAVHLRHHGPGRAPPTTRTAPHRRVHPGRADTVNGWINGLTAERGGTNWDRGLFQVAAERATASTSPWSSPTATRPSTATREGPGNYTRFREVENGIFSANAVKADGNPDDRLRRRRRRRAARPGQPVGPSRARPSTPTTSRPPTTRRPATACGPSPSGACPGSRHRRQAGRAEHGARRARSPVPYRPAAGSSGPRPRRAGVTISPA